MLAFLIFSIPLIGYLRKKSLRFTMLCGSVALLLSTALKGALQKSYHKNISRKNGGQLKNLTKF